MASAIGSASASSSVDADAAAAFVLTRLPEDALVLVFQFLPASTHASLCCVCRSWYRYSSYTDVFAELLARRVRYWMEWMMDQEPKQQTLAHLLSVHPILSSASANEHLELTDLTPATHPTMPRSALATAASSSSPPAASNASSAAALAHASPRVTIQSAQLLNLVEILCSARSGGRAVRNTRESHMQPFGEQLLAPLESFAIEQLHLSRMSVVDTSLLRALVRLPSLTALELAECKMITDAGVAALLHPHSGLRSLARLDLSENRQLKGAWMPDGTEDESSDGEERPSTLTCLNVSGCSSLSARSFPFSRRFLAPLRVLQASRCNGSFLAVLVASLHRCVQLRELDVSTTSWTGSPALCALIRSGRLLLEEDSRGGNTASSVSLEQLALSYASELPLVVGLEPCMVDLAPLEHLSTLTLPPQLPESIFAYLLLLCAPGSLTSLHISACSELSASSLEWISERVGQGLRTLHADGMQWEEERLQQILRPTTETAAGASSSSSAFASPSSPVSFPALTSLHVCGWVASLSSLSVLLRACPRLEEIDLSQLCAGYGTQRERAARAVAHEWTREAAMRAERDRETIRQHARENGLNLPEEVLRGTALVEADVAAADEATMPTRFGDELMSTLASLPHLRRVLLREEALLCDEDLMRWAQELRAQASARQTQLCHVDVSDSPNVSTAGVRALLDACMPPSTASSSRVGPTSVLIIADECPLVRMEDLPASLRPYVQTSGTDDA